uniref:Uncharacterized protein n=1 Tax=Anopheles atroparvus TaxID=41427 RepID=A0AAG5DVQ7_ANOAO
MSSSAQWRSRQDVFAATVGQNLRQRWCCPAQGTDRFQKGMLEAFVHPQPWPTLASRKYRSITSNTLPNWKTRRA